MSCASVQAVFSANTCTFSSPTLFKKYPNGKNRRNLKFSSIRSSTSDDADCNTEECAPDKEVGKVSLEWLAGEKTKVSGTFPPRTRGWTGYVEKDTAGQTNIYPVEPPIYIAESAISSGTAGSSSDGAENTAALVAGAALIAIAAASSILLQISKNPTPVQTVEYNGPSLAYYINKFKAEDIVQASAPSPAESPASSPQESSATPEAPQVQSLEISTPEAPQVQPVEISTPEAPQVQVQSELQPEPSTSSENAAS